MYSSNLAHLNQAEGKILSYEIHKHIRYILNKNCHSNGKYLFLYTFIKAVINWTALIIQEYHSLTTSYKIVPYILLSKLTLYVDETTVNHHCGFWHNISTTDQIFCICQILERNGSKM